MQGSFQFTVFDGPPWPSRYFSATGVVIQKNSDSDERNCLWLPAVGTFFKLTDFFCHDVNIHSPLHRFFQQRGGSPSTHYIFRIRRHETPTVKTKKKREWLVGTSYDNRWQEPFEE